MSAPVEPVKACPLCQSSDIFMIRQWDGTPLKVACRECGCVAPFEAWDIRFRDAAPDLLEALEWIAANYENCNINHVDFRVEAKHRADVAIAKAGGASA